MSVFICLIIPVVLIILILLTCKWNNFSIIPSNLKLPAPQKFQLPKIRRNLKYQWEISDENNDSEEEDSDLSDTDDDSDHDSE
jgi:hypothetical protein